MTEKPDRIRALYQQEIDRLEKLLGRLDYYPPSARAQINQIVLTQQLVQAQFFVALLDGGLETDAKANASAASARLFVPRNFNGCGRKAGNED